MYYICIYIIYFMYLEMRREWNIKENFESTTQKKNDTRDKPPNKIGLSIWHCLLRVRMARMCST